MIILFLASFITNLFWFLGVIFADISYLIVSALILVILLLPFTLKNYNEFDKFFKTRKGKVIEDERQTYIKEQAGYMTYGITLTLAIYSLIAILTLRNQYPEYQIIVYPLIIFIILSFIIYGISSIYYKRKY
ncbi:DUF2178 domain-containing protein [Methanobrevibacter sp. DSM 116169]|uniref:DUF2178 domain-containing protein n=1 Tax=Methanobrevibacter sp. DSM 116169 TaxID=3242727 RepID=UPI0038FC8FDC